MYLLKIQTLLFFFVNLNTKHDITVNAIYSIFETLFGPDLYLPVPQIIERKGYVAEVHTVQTEDGYLLQLHRIPFARWRKNEKTKRYPVLLFHGLMASSHDWIINGPEKSLSYRLADAGYDVWLANMRGNVYSNGHAKYFTDQYRYWNFSIQEMGVYDLPANIDYILNTTNHRRLVLISHSVGTTVFYVMASLLPEYSDKIQAQISFSAISAIPNNKQEQGIDQPFNKVENFTSRYLYHGAFKTDLAAKLFYKILCNPFTSYFCTYYIIFPVFGKDLYEYDASLTAAYYGHSPAGTSLKMVENFGQLKNADGIFGYFDYGETGNLKHYGMRSPPKYNLSKINVPVRIYYSKNDVVSTPIDCEILYRQLPAPLGLIKVKYDAFNHLDFLASKSINRLLNNDVIQFINNATNPISGDYFVSSSVRNAIKLRALMWPQ